VAWRTADILNKQQWTAGKGWLSSSGDEDPPPHCCKDLEPCAAGKLHKSLAYVPVQLQAILILGNPDFSRQAPA